MPFFGLLYPESDARSTIRKGDEFSGIGPLWSTREEAEAFLAEEMVDVDERGLPVVPVLLEVRGERIVNSEVLEELRRPNPPTRYRVERRGHVGHIVRERVENPRRRGTSAERISNLLVQGKTLTQPDWSVGPDGDGGYQILDKHGRLITRSLDVYVIADVAVAMGHDDRDQYYYPPGYRRMPIRSSVEEPDWDVEMPAPVTRPRPASRGRRRINLESAFRREVISALEEIGFAPLRSKQCR